MSPSPPAASAAADPDPKTTFLGIFLGAFFGIDFGTILGPLLEPFWETFWTHFGVILELRCLSTRRFAIRLCFNRFLMLSTLQINEKPLFFEGFTYVDRDSA